MTSPTGYGETTEMPRTHRSIVVTLASTLALAGCGSDTPQPDPADSDASALSAAADDLTSALGAAREEFGDIEVDLLLLHIDHASLLYVDPSDPDASIRREYRDGDWGDPSPVPRPGSRAELPLDEIDPETARDALDAAPRLLEMDSAELGHVSVSADETGRAEYLVSLTLDGALGRVTFGPDGEVRELDSPR